MILVIRAAAAVSGHLTGAKESTVGRSMVSINFRNSGFVVGLGCAAVGGKRCSFPTDETKATMSMLCESLRYFSAMAPAATRPDNLRLSATGVLAKLNTALNGG